MPHWKQLGSHFLSLFLNPNCALCGRSAKTIICDHCNRQLHQCQFSNPKFQGKDQIPRLIWGEYRDSLKRAIGQLKYDKQPQLAQPLGEYLGQSWLTASLLPGSCQPIVVPIPLHAQKQQQRGYNQAELLARHFCRVTGLPLKEKGLKRIKPTEALFGLSPQQRATQMANAFTLGTGVTFNQPVILIDDIYTTGTTVEVAQKRLQQSGISVVAICAIATSPRNELDTARS